MNFETIKLATEGRTALLTLNRPDKRNAISPQMIDELLAAFDEIEAGPVCVVILTGAGKAFCAGMDLDALRESANASHGQQLEDSRRTAYLFRRIWGFPKPTIAAVNGAAIAGGSGLATLCDFTLAAPDAKFGYTEVNIGFVPAFVSVFLARQIGEKSARELLLSGRIFDAQEAHHLGLVTMVVAGDCLLGRAREIASAVAAASPSSIAQTKRLLIASAAEDVDRELGAAIAASAAVRRTSDFKEGLAAFLEKRPPKWTGR
ncbi:MAG: enoyl-CoA hydratase/isomerase family protein [Candidatus Acidiferrales bacterium]